MANKLVDSSVFTKSWQFFVCTSLLDDSIAAEAILLESGPLDLEVIGRTSLRSSPNQHGYEVTYEISTINIQLILKTCRDNFLAKLNVAKLQDLNLRSINPPYGMCSLSCEEYKNP